MSPLSPLSYAPVRCSSLACCCNQQKLSDVCNADDNDDDDDKSTKLMLITLLGLSFGWRPAIAKAYRRSEGGSKGAIASQKGPKNIFYPKIPPFFYLSVQNPARASYRGHSDVRSAPPPRVVTPPRQTPGYAYERRSSIANG